jgi:hypothetical protein
MRQLIKLHTRKYDWSATVSLSVAVKQLQMEIEAREIISITTANVGVKIQRLDCIRFV